MAIGEVRVATAVQRSSLGAIVAGLGTCVLTAYTWWSARGGVPTPDVSAVILLLIPVGVVAGLLSGRLRDAPLSWAAAVAGSILAYQLTNLLDPAKVSGFATILGGTASHTAIMARSLQLPAVVGLQGASQKIQSGATALVPPVTTSAPCNFMR